MPRQAGIETYEPLHVYQSARGASGADDGASALRPSNTSLVAAGYVLGNNSYRSDHGY